ncbi:MAG: hypothetical protein H7331_02380 [Bacteroidia bacterium]|nr:hypothetical protein [Bacteroidia bacterium]
MNPFKPTTVSYQDWETLKDLQWHCTKCELKAGQAKTWQIWRQEKGIQMDVDFKEKHASSIFCITCNSKTVHRKLKSLDILEETKARSGISQKLALKIKSIYKNEEAILLRNTPPNELEIDHKFPQIRWSKDEDKYSDEITEKEVRDKFILLNRSGNQLKSRNCERCVKNGDRGNFPGIYFWFLGNEKWNAAPNDEAGCVGCFWHDPYKWREELNKEVNKKY